MLKQIKEGMIVSIHQPNFFPWMGFFDKLNRSDKFVFLTSSVRSKNDKYLTRTRLLGHSKPCYINNLSLNALKKFIVKKNSNDLYAYLEKY